MNFENYRLSVCRYADILVARRYGRELASSIGFNTENQEQISLVVTELASNLIKYVGRGIIQLKAISEEDRVGILIASFDQGSGFNVEQALSDGYSSSGTLGVGLGAVKRMVDSMIINSRVHNQSGTDIVCRKWLQSHSPAKLNQFQSPLDIGLVTQAKTGFEVNGDACLINQDFMGNYLVAIIDGVGHGIPAFKAASVAKEYILNNNFQALPELFRGVEEATQNTRGVVMAIAYFHHFDRTLTFASVGNIDSKIVGVSEKYSLGVRRGILGRQAPRPVVNNYAWTPEMHLVMHSDGISSRWQWSDFAHLADRSAQSIAEHMFRKLYKDSDDATLIYVK